MSLYSLKIIMYLCVYVCGHAHVMAYVWWWSGATCESQFSPSSFLAVEIELRLSGLAASTFPGRAILPNGLEATDNGLYS